MPTITEPVSFTFRDEVRQSDVAAVRQLVHETGFFSSAEVDIAVELVVDRLEKQAASDYHFLFADQQPAEGTAGRVLGYACFGEIPCTVGSYDLYWIATDVQFQGQGIGRKLLQQAEERIRQRGGRHVYAETSSRVQYASTRRFYELRGYDAASTLEDFYGPGDGKVTYRKILPAPGQFALR
ncbi:MAG: GNAT family N-acetyltransferase [Rubinisphaera brasiliensis]|uniref:GNAT family N-acetyltransferase n=1 Tax=Rubinisphaera brasiliensis TaxID=119 RepID=UPI0039195156